MAADLVTASSINTRLTIRGRLKFCHHQKKKPSRQLEIDCVFGYRVAVFIESDPHFSSASSEEHITNAELPTDR